MPYKECSKCQEKNGVRTLNCKKCGNIFIAKVSSPIKEKRVKSSIPVVNWKEELHKGDIVKIKQGGGPFYLLENGERHYLSITGVVRIESIEENGFWASHYLLKHKRGSFFVYMGKTTRSSIDPSLIRKRHKLVKLNLKKER